MTNKSDIYAYGMLIYEMLTLSMPHMHVFPEEEDFEGVDQSSQEAWEEAEDEYQQSLGKRELRIFIRFGCHGSGRRLKQTIRRAREEIFRLIQIH